MKANIQKEAYKFTKGISTTDQESFIPRFKQKFNRFHKLTRVTKKQLLIKKDFLQADNCGHPNTKNFQIRPNYGEES